MTAGQRNYTIEQGVTWSIPLTYKDATGSPVNLTGYTAKMTARENLNSAAVIFSLTTENGGITLGGAAGTITLFMSSTTTGAITVDGGIYNLSIISAGGVVTRLEEGDIIISKKVPDA